MPTPIRNGIAKNLTITHEANTVLQELAPTSHSHGRYVSELLIAERARREEREKLRQVLRQAFPEDG